MFLALRYLRPKRTFVSVITLISVIGVMLGVAVLIIVISVMSGFDKQLRDKILGFNAHLRITNSQDTINNYADLIEMVRKNPHVTGAAPGVMGQVLLETEPQNGNPLVAAPWIRGIDPSYETNVSVVHTSIIEGSFDLSGNSVLVGRELARGLRLEVGDRVAVYAPSPKQLEMLRKEGGKEGDRAILPEEYTVRGVFDVGFYEYNANIILVSLENAQDLYHLKNTVHHILVMLDNPFRAEEVRTELAQKLPPGMRMSLWTEENSGILTALLVEKNVMFYLLFFIMIVAAFGIMNSLITFVVQKTREIGMLKALGATRGQVLWLFLSQSLTVGIVGDLAGLGLGLLAITYRNEFLRFMRKTTGFELFPSNIYGFDQLPALVSPSDIAVICGSALVICVLAGLVPAWTAARLEPVEALRHE